MIKAAALGLMLALQAHAAPPTTVILYSSLDVRCQAPVAALASVYGPVVDYRAQQPGTIWRPYMAAKIAKADVVLVLWSSAAAQSSELAPELRMAYAARGRLVPILLDSTPMPAELGARQAVNLEGLCASASSSPP